MSIISIVVPCFNEEEALPLFYKEILNVIKFLPEQNFEIIFVDDGSKDKTLSLLRDFSKRNNQVKYLSFSRNFGKESAMLAGLKSAHGDFVAIMDADMQDPPSLLPEMYDLLSDGYDCVASRRVTRKGEPHIRSFCARCFYKFMNRISDVDIADGARDFRLMTRQMVDAILSVNEYNRFSKGIFCWVGFNTKWLEYENVERVAGESKWSFAKLLKYSFNGITAFSTTPLAFSSFVGFIFCLISLMLAVVYAMKTIVWGEKVTGFPTLICIILLVGGLLLFSIGILGKYLAETYLETKRRPPFIIKETEQSIR